MRVLALAAGLATGYVLGARAGREKYDQIATAARQVSGRTTSDELESTEPVPTPVVESTPEVVAAKPRRPRNRRPKAATTSASDATQTMSTADLTLDTLPLEAAEADVVEQNMLAADTSEEPARTPVPLESDAADVREQRRSL